MTEQKLNVAQVAGMLVSTSCGVGFLLGTGELALHQGMAACLYPIATALGLTALALCSRLLWASGQSVWTWFNRLYGPSVSRSVALLSLVWMTGVLGAQIRGGAALLVLAGLPRTSAYLIIDVVLIGLSVMSLSWLSVGFAICMLACNTTLVGALIETRGIDVWLHAPVRFVNTLPQFMPVRTGFAMISIVLMVVCGADYQQFLIAARTPSTASVDCILAAGIVLAIGFLPASAVIAASAAGHLEHLADPVQVIPVVIIHTLSGYAASTARTVVIAMLTSTALGAGSAILRAMSDATTTLGPRTGTRPIWSRVLPVLFGSLVAAREQSLIGMMVDLDVVYITAVGLDIVNYDVRLRDNYDGRRTSQLSRTIGPLLGLTLLNAHVSNKTANATIMAGCTVAMACYLMRWTGLAAIPEVIAPPFALSLSLVVALASRSRNNASFGKSSQLPASHRPNSPPNTQSSSVLSSRVSGNSGGN